jgi:hypothetical protein
VNEPGARQGLPVVEDVNAGVGVDDRKALVEMQEVGAAGVEFVWGDEIASIQRVEERRGEAALEHVGLVILLLVSIERGEVFHVASHLDRVRALEVVEVETKRLVDDEEALHVACFEVMPVSLPSARLSADMG